MVPALREREPNKKVRERETRKLNRKIWKNKFMIGKFIEESRNYVDVGWNRVEDERARVHNSLSTNKKKKENYYHFYFGVFSHEKKKPMNFANAPINVLILN